MASAWDNGPQPTSASAASDAVDHARLKALVDPAVDALVESALVDNPTLRQAIARMDQARATARVSDAQRLPQISVNGSVARARTGGVQTGGGALTTTQSTATLGSGLSWELDLWGRLKETARAAGGRPGPRPAETPPAR